MPDLREQFDHHAFLASLADRLGQVVAEGGESFLVHVSPQPDGPDVALLPLEGLAPADALLGTVAPEAWSALGVAAGGWAGSVDGPASERVRAEIVILVARDGHVVSRVRYGDDVLREPPANGLTLDCLQRALGLPTAPPEVPVAELLAVEWLERILDAGRRRRPLSWSAIRRLHPAEEVGECPDWGQLRWLAVEGRWEVPGLTPTEAAWCDDGAFSRWALDGRPPSSALLAALPGVVGTAHARRCARIARRPGTIIR